MKAFRLYIPILFCIFLFLAGCVKSSSVSSSVNYQKDTLKDTSVYLLVKYKTMPIQAAASVGNDKISSYLYRLNYSRIKIDKLKLQSKKTELLKDKNVIAVIEDELIPPAQSNDPLLSRQWHHTASSVNSFEGWSLSSSFYPLVNNSNATIVAVLDSGVSTVHPDITNQVPGWNFFDNNNLTDDPQGHGTAVAGVIGATHNNAIGLSGISNYVRIMPVRISYVDGYAYWSTIATGIMWAADNGARVANVSYECSQSPLIRDAADYMWTKNGIVVVSSGNNGRSDYGTNYPKMLVAGAIDRYNVIASFSNKGPLVDLVAPGVGVWTLTRPDTYGTWVGTSFSAPGVCAVVAVIKNMNPYLPIGVLKELVLEGCDDLGDVGYDYTYGWGKINLGKTVGLFLARDYGDVFNSPPSIRILTPLQNQYIRGRFKVTVDAQDDKKVSSVTYYIDGVKRNTSTTSPFSVTIDFSKKYSKGMHTIYAVATDNEGVQTTSSTVTFFTY